MSEPAAIVEIIYDRMAHGELMQRIADKNPEDLDADHSAFPPDLLPMAVAVLSLNETVADKGGVHLNGPTARAVEGKKLWLQVTTHGLVRDRSEQEQAALVNEAVEVLARTFFCKLARRP